jgi:hypothetical protein
MSSASHTERRLPFPVSADRRRRVPHDFGLNISLAVKTVEEDHGYGDILRKGRVLFCVSMRDHT